jgi:hypothetical protein
MRVRTLAVLAAVASVLTACATAPQASQAPTQVVPPASRPNVAAPVKAKGGICYGTVGVEASPCPVKLTKKDKGSVIVTIEGPGVAIATPIASDCVGSGSVCNVSRYGSEPTEFVISSVIGENVCGKAWVVFEGLTASGGAIGTATVEVINKYC